MPTRLEQIFKSLKAPLASGDLAVHSPASGEIIANLAIDSAEAVDEKIWRARAAQLEWYELPRIKREALIAALAASYKEHRETLAEIISLEAGKTSKEALGEADSAAEVLLKTIKDATLPELNGMMRVKERLPAGVAGLITSFNFPLVVASWTLAPALLAGNGVVWKPSEKTPLSAIAAKAIFDKAAGKHKDLLQVIIGAHEAGAALVAHEQVDVVSATGSVGMGNAIKAALAKKENNAVAPILELGGNNGAILSDKLSRPQLEWSVAAIMHSFLGTTGQRCTNTRRVFVHKKIHAQAVEIFKAQIETFLAGAASGFAPDNAFGYGALIDRDAFERFEGAKNHAAADGKVLFGKRLFAERFPHAYYVEPALALLPKQTPIMHREIFAPLLFIVPYDKQIDRAMAMLNAPDNAGLVAAMYTQSQKEADAFAALCQAGHALINSPKGTGTPAYGMGFGGNKDSGVGEILNAADPLAAFTRPGHARRIAQNKDVAMDAD